MTELHYLDAATALRLFRTRELSPVELMEAVIARTEAVNGEINALTETLFEEALPAARQAAAKYARGRDLTPLLGLPVAAKEKHGLKGRRLSQGLVARKDELAAEDHPVIDRIRRAGGIVHARTTTPEYSCATVTHSQLWGVTRNPWNLHFSPGGSSGGSGAALAAGLAPLATASDIAGSTRLPASFTGTVGYKAPYGRIPGLAPLSADHYRGDGPMARTVADAALLANVMAGRHPGDHTSLADSPGMAVPGRETLDGGTSVAESVAGMRIALCIRLGNYPVAPDVEANTRAVVAALRDAGAVIEEVELPWTTESISRTMFTHFGYLLGPAMEDETEGARELLAPYTRRFMADARRAAEENRYLDGIRAETRLQAELAAAMAGFDALICPASAVAALDADGMYLEGIDAGGLQLEHYWQGHMTAPFNIANRCPVLAVPSGLADCGIPTGVQIVGHPYDDATVFSAGAAVEALRPLAARRPDILAMA